MAEWVNFRQVCELVNVERLLEKLNIQPIKVTGDEIRLYCPMCKKGDFCISSAKKVWTCHACKEKGNVLDLMSKLHGVSVRSAAIGLQQMFAAPVEAKKSGYMAEVDAWLEELRQGDWEAMKKAIKNRLLESYNNGKRAAKAA